MKTQIVSIRVSPLVKHALKENNIGLTETFEKGVLSHIGKLIEYYEGALKKCKNQEQRELIYEIITELCNLKK